MTRIFSDAVKKHGDNWKYGAFHELNEAGKQELAMAILKSEEPNSGDRVDAYIMRDLQRNRLKIDWNSLNGYDQKPVQPMPKMTII